MENVHKGPVSELKSAFESLSSKKREKYEKIVEQNRRQFMENLQNYIASVDKNEQESFRAKIQKTLQVQDEKIKWSKIKDSSDESESSGSSSCSDSDSD